jgi:UPF0755 protein
MAKGKGGIIKKILFLFIAGIIAFAGYWAYENVFKSNVRLDGKKYTYIFIKSNSSYQEMLDEIYSQNIIEDKESFEWTARKMDLQNNVHFGKFRIDESMSNRSIVNAIKKNKQEKVKLYFNSQIRTQEQFINYVSEKIEVEKSELEDFCNDDTKLSDGFNLNSKNMMCLIVPKTYEISWATTLDEFTQLLKQSYDSVWTTDKKNKAKSINYTIPEVITLASIVQSESSIKSEQQKIAGVYINRLKQDMKLQADPTIVFANQNFEVQRVLSVDKEIDSPYNTYMYKGLPPGPICLVQPSSIDAVLNYSKHAHTFFCAKPDFSGYSNFTNDYSVHQKNAKAYQDALNKKGINR